MVALSLARTELEASSSSRVTEVKGSRVSLLLRMIAPVIAVMLSRIIIIDVVPRSSTSEAIRYTKSDIRDVNAGNASCRLTSSL